MRILNQSIILGILMLAACTPAKKNTEASITSEAFGVMPDSTEVTSYTLTNANGIEMKVITYGGIVTSLKIPDKEGNLENVVMGYDNLQGYLDASPFFGAIIGRYGNRIARGQFTLDSVEYTLAANNGLNHLHGGNKGFDKVVWDASPVELSDGVGLKLTYTSSDMEEGYPGTLKASVIYTLFNDDTWECDYSAVTDKKTIVNLTQHSYFNLTSFDEDILGHKLMINASQYLPVDSTLIPTGELRAVEGTPFDFTEVKTIGKDIKTSNQQLEYGLGFDHCWILNESADELTLAATLHDSASGRMMEILTTEPGIQFYSGNFLDGTITGRDGNVYGYRTGLCLETQHFPDSPNQPEFPSVVLAPGETYHTLTRFVFSVKD